MANTTLSHIAHDLPSAALATFLALFPIVNPFGGIPTFFALTSGFTRGERNQTAHRTGFYVFAILVTFLFFGRFVLHFFGISLPVLKIASGLIVANTAWGMVTASNRIRQQKAKKLPPKRIFRWHQWQCPFCRGPGR